VRKLCYVVGASVDGFIAAPDGSYDFFPLAPDFLEYLGSELVDTLPAHMQTALGVESRVARFDTIVMGRATYEPALQLGVTNPYPHLRQYVVSTSIRDVGDPAVTLVPDDPLRLVQQLKQEDSGRDVYLAGGGILAGALLPEIDEIVVKRYPLVLGSGIPMLAGAFAPSQLELVGDLAFSNGTKVQTYRRLAAPA
jgi:dihydrofolate reductase